MPTYDGTILDTGGAVFNVRSSTYGAVGNGVNDDTAEIQAAINAAAAVPRGVVRIPPGTYVVSALTVPAGITIEGYGAVLLRPANQGKWTRTLTTSYSGSADSAPLVIRGLTIDGNSANQGAYHNYELEQAHLIFVEGDYNYAGRLRVILEDLVLRNCVADGISIYRNVDAQVTNCRANDCWRGGLTVTGGYTKVQVQNFSTTGLVDPTGLDIEVDGPGYGNSLAVDVSIDGMKLDADFDVGLGTGSSFFGTNIDVAAPPFNLVAPGSVVRLENSRFRVGSFSSTGNRIVYPNDVTFANCIFELSGVAESGDMDGAAAHIFWNLGGSETVTGQRLRFIDCDFRVAPGVGSGLTLAAIYAQADDTAHDNRLIVLGGSVASRFNYGLYMAQGGTWIIKETEIEAATGIYWLGVQNPQQNVVTRANIRIERVVFTGSSTYMNIVSYDAGNTLDHRDVVLEAAQNVLATTYGIVGNVYRGGRLIRVASAPTAGSVPGLVGDRARLATPVAGADYEWICTASSTTAATWKKLTTLSV
ncbi:MAG TPA: glycosyl hydrolase family 28-related protein [Longimicrobium sp.]|jgi:hypothetical protein